MSEVYSVQIAICPKCDGDMLHDSQLDDGLNQRIRQEFGSKLGDADFPYEYHLCPACSVIVVEGNEHKARTEYRQMLHHTDENSDALIEIRASDSPDMEAPKANWYAWKDNQPVLDTNYTGVDDAFDEIMTGVDL